MYKKLTNIIYFYFDSLNIFLNFFFKFFYNEIMNTSKFFNYKRSLFILIKNND